MKSWDGLKSNLRMQAKCKQRPFGVVTGYLFMGPPVVMGSDTQEQTET